MEIHSLGSCTDCTVNLTNIRCKMLPFAVFVVNTMCWCWCLGEQSHIFPAALWSGSSCFCKFDFCGLFSSCCCFCQGLPACRIPPSSGRCRSQRNQNYSEVSLFSSVCSGKPRHLISLWSEPGPSIRCADVPSHFWRATGFCCAWLNLDD